MVLFQHLEINTGPVIIPFRESLADNLDQVGITGVVLRQKHQMIIAVLPARQFPVKPGVGRHIDLTANDRIDAFRLRRLIKVNDTIHHSVIRNGRAVHAKFFDPLHIFFNLIGTVQQTELRVDMQMCKCHDGILPENRIV